MEPRTVASYCTTFLKAEMLHVYRQVAGLQRWRTFAVAKARRNEERFPFEDVELVPGVKTNFVRRFWLKYVRREPPIVYRGEYGVLADVLARRRADLMHVYFGHTGVHLLPFIRRWPRPVVVSFHGMDVMAREDKPGYREGLEALLRELPLVMARSESLKERLVELGCDPAKVRLNRTGIPIDEFPAAGREVPPEGGWRLVQACRLIPKKGLDVALEAFAGLRERFPSATFTIAGDGPLREDLERQAGELGVAGAVTFAGFLSPAELNALYARSHVFVHPSRTTADGNREGVPNSMLEAMATGLPVVATRHGGIPEAVSDGVSGLLVGEGDAAGLRASLERLCGDPGTWRAMGEGAAGEVREKFEQRAQIEKLESIYDEVMETSQGKAVR